MRRQGLGYGARMALLVLFAVVAWRPCDAAEPSRSTEPRALVSVGGELGGVFSPGVSGGGIGAFAELGVQATDLWGIGLDASGAAIPGLMGYGRVAVTADATPMDGMTLRLGPCFGGSFGTILPPGPGPVVQHAMFVGVTLGLQLNWAPTWTSSGRRRGVTLAIVGDLAENLVNEGWGGPGGLSDLSTGIQARIGYSWY